MSFPGSDPPTPREIQAANRRLITAMQRRKAAKRKLAAAERDYVEARARVRDLIDLLARGGARPPETGLPRCDECQTILGANPKCLSCQGAGLIVAP